MEGLYYYWNSQLRAGWAIGMSADITTQITYNDITGQGLYIINIPEPVEGYNVQIHMNRFLGEDRWGVYNMSGVTVNATCNWWDHILGPTHTGNPLGEGNKSSDYVIYQPWCYNYELDCGEVPLPVELSSFNAVVTANLYVQLLWTAETETNMLGYNVFRSEDEEVSNALKFNDVLIGASNGSVAANYSYTDMDVVPGMTYYYWLEINDLDLTTQFYGPISVLVNLEEEGPEIPSIPLETKLIGAYPNPFNPGTSIGFSLAEPSRVTITIYNSKGQLIRTLINSQEFAEGRNHSVYFDGKNQQGKDIASGIYFYIMQTNTDHSEVKKMLLLK
jgi:hypothetical protein